MVGQRIGNYSVLRKIGDGGMGSVFEAVHDGIGRKAAVKVLHPRYSEEPAVVARFFNEARAVNIVQHPGIVGCFDYGQLPDGTAYIIMEFLDGESLKARMKRLHRLGPDALRLCRQLAGTLAAAHTRGIVHRDLKPDNVIIVPDPEAPGGERAKILDFGIAKLTGDHAPDAPEMTQAGTVMGTPKYMSPEQCKGAALVDSKADVYSLGVMLFEMLAGRLPFEAEGTGALLAMQIYKPAPSLRAIEPSVSEREEALVQSMLDKDPTARPTMAQVAILLEQLGQKGTQALSLVSGPLAAYGVPSGSVSALSLGPPAASAPDSNSRPSILFAAGQTEDPTRVHRRRLSRFAVPAVVAILVASGSLFLLRSREEMPLAIPTMAAPAPATAPTPAPAPAPVHFSLVTTPAGAQVIRDGDGTVLGVTPWRMEQAPQPGELAVVVRKDGYEDQRLTVTLGQDFSQQLTLAPVEQVAPIRPTRPSRSASSRSRAGKGRAKEQSQDENVEIAPVH